VSWFLAACLVVLLIIRDRERVRLERLLVASDARHRQAAVALREERAKVRHLSEDPRVLIREARAAASQRFEIT
jgi:hypothetical protein